MNSMDSDYLQRQLKILADDMKEDDPDVAKAYLFIQHRLYMSYPDGDVSRENIEDLLNEPQGRKHSENMPDWALDQLFENKSSKKKSIKESKLSKIINRIIKEEVAKVRLKESNLQTFTSKDLPIKINNAHKSKGSKSFRYIEDKYIRKYGLFRDDGIIIDGVEYEFDGSDENGNFYLLPKKGLKESSSEQEIEDIAVDLIDYMGKELPTVNWIKNPRIMGFFREAGITDPRLIQQIYQRALQLNK